MPDTQPIENLDKYVDIEDALARVCGNKSIYKMLLGKVEKTMTIDQLCSEAAAGDFSSASNTAHSIKGVAANLSLKAVYGKIVEVEEHLKQGFAQEGELEALREIIAATLQCVNHVAATL